MKAAYFSRSCKCLVGSCHPGPLPCRQRFGRCCLRSFCHADQASYAQKRPILQEMSNVMWALAELNHTPPDEAASANLDWLTRLFQLPGQEPNAQNLRNTLFACAVLHPPVKGHVGTTLVDGLLSLDPSVVDKQAYCNAAWSLAVLDMLSVEIFSSLLERLQSLLVAELAHHFLTRQGLLQLYQALDFLQPLPTVATQQMREMLTRLGPRPLLNERSAAELSASKHLCAALGQLGLAFTANVPLSGYWADAALQPQNDSAAPLVLATEAYDHIRNRNKRCVKHFVLRLY